LKNFAAGGRGPRRGGGGRKICFSTPGDIRRWRYPRAAGDICRWRYPTLKRAK